MVGFAPANEDGNQGYEDEVLYPKCRREAARLMIDTGRTIAQMARERGQGAVIGPLGGSGAGEGGQPGGGTGRS